MDIGRELRVIDVEVHEPDEMTTEVETIGARTDVNTAQPERK